MTSMWVPLVPPAARPAIGIEGDEKPSQPAIGTTPNGRGRDATRYSPPAASCTTAMLTTQMITWRHLRNQAADSRTAAPNTAIPPVEADVLKNRVVPFSQPIRRSTTTSDTNPSTWCIAANEKWSHRLASPTTRNVTSSQSHPVNPMDLGSGGGAPVGLR